MENKVLSIEIGDLITKICVLSNNKKHPRVYQTVVFDTPERCIEDGYIQDRFTLAEAIKAQIKIMNTNVTNVIFTIFSSRIATHEVIIPPVKPKDIQAYVNAGAADYFPINISEYVISYMVWEKIMTKQNKNYRLLAIAVHNNLLQAYYELAKHLKLNIVSIDYMSNSILHILQHQINQKGTSMYVHVNERNTLVYILHNGIPELHRTIAYGSEDIIDRNPFAIESHDLVAGSQRYLINNIIRVIEYYTSRNKEKQIQTIYLNGIGTKCKHLEELLKQELEIQVKALQDLPGINFRQAKLPEGYKQSDFLDCIGAIYAPLGIVPKQYAEQVVKKTTVKEIIGVCSLVLVSCIVLVYISATSVANAKTEKQKLESSIAVLEQTKSLFDENRALVDKLNILTSINDSCYSNTEHLNNLIEELEKKLPESIIIRSMQVDDINIILDVCMDTKDAAAMTFLQLGTIDMLTEVKTEQINIETDEYGATKLSYIITAKYTSQSEEG